MDDLFGSTSGAEVIATLLLAAVLYHVGGAAVQQRPRLRTLGSRIGMAAFLLACGSALFAERDFDPAMLLLTVLRGLVLGALATGVSWLLLPVLAFMHQAGVAKPRAIFDRAVRNRRQRASRRREAEEHAETLRRQREEYERLAPDRERAKSEAEARASTEAQAQKRRADIRAECEFLYHLYSPEVELRFARAKYDDFVQKYLGDEQSPEDVTKHAEKLRTLIETHVKRADPQPRFTSLTDLTAWYSAQKSQIEALETGTMQSTLLARLNRHYAELSVQVLQES